MGRKTVRIAAVVLNFIVAALQLNVWIGARMYGLTLDTSWTSVLLLLAPILAVIALLWPNKTRKT